MKSDQEHEEDRKDILSSQAERQETLVSWFHKDHFALCPGKEPTVRNQTWVLPLGAGGPVIV